LLLFLLCYYPQRSQYLYLSIIKKTHLLYMSPDGANVRLRHDVWETNSVIFKKANKSRVCDFCKYNNFKYLRIPTWPIFANLHESALLPILSLP